MCEPATLTVIGTQLAAGSFAAAASTAMVGTAAVAGGAAASAGLLGTAGALSLGTALTTASAASGVASLYGQQQAADAQGAANQTQYNNSLLARAQNANQISLERMQANEAAGQKLNANSMAMREALSTKVAAAGPSGLSVDALLADIGRKAAVYDQSVTSNLDKTNMALDNQLENVNNQASSTINSLKAPTPVDYLGTALKIGDQYKKYKA